MRVKNNSLIALGIGIGLSSFIFSGCTTGGGGFLNLGVADALQKSKACIFKQKLSYKKPFVSAGKFSLPTIGTRPANVALPTTGHPIAIDSFTIQSQGLNSPTSDCGCGTDTSVPTEQYYMPIRPQRADVLNVTPGEIVEPPAILAPTRQIDDAQLPDINPLPLDNGVPSIGTELDSNGTEGTFEPIGQSAPIGPSVETHLSSTSDLQKKEDAVVISPAKRQDIVEQRTDVEESIFEAAKTPKYHRPNFDEATNQNKPVQALKKPTAPKMVTLHARPAQSHNVFTPEQQHRKSLKAMQASHRSNFRRQNSLRDSKSVGQEYRQAMNTDEVIDFKPLPPVNEALPVRSNPPSTQPLPTPATSGVTPTFNDIRNRTADQGSRTPILRATTVSSASILSLKNLANVIGEPTLNSRDQSALSRTAKGDAADQGRTSSLK